MCGAAIEDHIDPLRKPRSCVPCRHRRNAACAPGVAAVELHETVFEGIPASADGAVADEELLVEPALLDRQGVVGGAPRCLSAFQRPFAPEDSSSNAAVVPLVAQLDEKKSPASSTSSAFAGPPRPSHVFGINVVRKAARVEMLDFSSACPLSAAGELGSFARSAGSGSPIGRASR
jgi:hypothetical protein